MNIMIDGIERVCERGQTYRDVIKGYWADARLMPLGVCVKGLTYSLNEKVKEGESVRVLTYMDEEGRRIYERSLQFLFTSALKRLLPDVRVRVEHSLGQGVFIKLAGVPVTAALLNRIESEMREMTKADLPITRTERSREEAIEYFTAKAQFDKVRLLEYRSSEWFTFYELDGELDYFYGELAPSTSYISVYAVKLYLPGLLLQMPDIDEPTRASPVSDYSKLMREFTKSAKWLKNFDCENATDLNRMVEDGDYREFIRINEALHERRIQRIADRFVETGARIILIAGPSSSGKTTFANRLNIALRVLGLKPVKISLDDYYINREDIPIGDDGQRDFERLDALDTKLLDEQLVRLLQGETVMLPEFDFISGKRKENAGHELTVSADQPIIIEGIHALNDALTEGVPRELKFKVYISALTLLNLDDHNRIRTTDARLLRRLVRDHQFRGTPPEKTIAMWESVRRGEDNYIFPCQEQADMMFNSSLFYELPIIKKYAYPSLIEITPDSEYYTLARRLIKFLNYVRTADCEDEIPVNSILREFIGGNCFYRE